MSVPCLIETCKEDEMLLCASRLIGMQRLSRLLVSLTEQFPFGERQCVCARPPDKVG